MSSSVFLSNVDDYFAPSQACVNPLFAGGGKAEGEKKEEVNKKKAGNANVVIPRQHRIRQRRQQPQQEQQQSVVVNGGDEKANATAGSSVSSYVSESLPPPANSTAINTTVVNNITMKNAMNTETHMDNVDPVVKASIADCLACSGCVTTAETVLLEEKHSLDLLRQRFAVHPSSSSNANYSNHFLLQQPMVMTISPAAWADLARHLDLSSSSSTSSSSSSTNNHHHIDVMQRQWTTLLDQTFTGLALVLDGNVPLQWSLLQAAQEFCQRHHRSHHGHHASSSSSSLPLLVSSSCPAVVCLVEKSIHQAVPHLSTTKSAMSMAGAYLRNTAAAATASTLLSLSSSSRHDDAINHDDTMEWKGESKSLSSSFFHVAVMPCHDKKLEASRASSAAAAATTALSTTDNMLPPDTDLVITTSECLQLLQEAQALRLLKAETPNKDMMSSTTPLDDSNNDSSGSSSSLYKVLLSCSPAPFIATNDEESGDAQSFLSRLDAAVAAARNATTKTVTTLITVASSSSPCSSDAVTEQTSTSSSSSAPFVYGSGGYADYIFRYACRELYGFHIGCSVNPWKLVEMLGTTAAAPAASQALRNRKSVRVAASQQRNRQRDYYQAILYQHTGTGEYSLDNKNSDNNEYEPVLKFAIAYGMQTLQRVLKPFHDASDTKQQHQQKHAFYDYIEAMACPSGCLNGGGQLPLTATSTTKSQSIATTSSTTNNNAATAIIAARETPTQTRQRVQMTLSHFVQPSPNISTQPPFAADEPSSSSCSSVSSAILSRIPVKRRHATYHAVAPLQLSMGAAAGVAVQDIQW
jgi:iron only hydrogenase large subunit-like protein